MLSSDHQPDRRSTASILLRLTEDDDGQYDVVAAGSMVLLCVVLWAGTLGYSGVTGDTRV